LNVAILQPHGLGAVAAHDTREDNMEPIDWGQAWSIVGGGLLTTFTIMALLALTTTILGKIFVSVEKRNEAKSGEAK